MRKKFWAWVALIRIAIGAARSKAWLELPIEKRLLLSSNAITRVA